VITDLLLLAAFSWPSGDLYEQSGILMVPWTASSELCVPFKSHGDGYRLVVLICHHFRVLKPSVAHN